MNNLLSFVSPLEFLLRYTVIIGIVVAIIGVAILLSAKRITMAKRKQEEINKNDSFYNALRIVGICLILAGMIIMVLPVNATLYKF